VKYTVQLLALAKADYRRTFHYIQERSLQGAENWELAFEQCLDRLRTNPTIYSLAPENDLYDYPLYQVLFRTLRGKRYRIVYRIDGPQVTVYRLRGHGQPPLEKGGLPNG
jgi:plasmid stabilization system protein ParE